MSRIVPFAILAIMVLTMAHQGSAQPRDPVVSVAPPANPKAEVAGIAGVAPPGVPEIYQNPRFSIEDSPAVVEGGELKFTIRREGQDWQPHTLNLKYSDEAGLVAPRASVEFAPGTESMVLTVNTRLDPAANGVRTIDVTISGAQGEEIDRQHNVAHGTINDLPPPAPPTYAIRLDGEALRGQPLTFVVTRVGSLPAAKVVYDVGSDGLTTLIETPLEFAADDRSKPITLAPGDYGLCADSIAVTLQGVTGETQAFATLSGAKPRACFPEPQPRPWWPWWPWGVVGIVVIAVCGGLWKWLRRPPQPDSIITDEFVDAGPDPGPEPDAPTPPVTADCVIGAGVPRLDLSDAAIGQWPPIEIEVTLKRGIARVPDPLPIAEQDDG